MRVERVIITNITRDVIKLRADGNIIMTTSGKEVKFDYIYLIGNQTFESSTELTVKENKTIEELEQMIMDIMNGE